MFHLDSHPMYIRIPEHFSEPSLYTKAMICLAMGITIRQFRELCDETLDEKALRVLVSEIGDKVKAKKGSLEVVYMIRDKDKKDASGHGVSAYGRRLKTLQIAMSVQLGSDAKAQHNIDEYTGLLVDSAADPLSQQTMDDFMRK